MSHPILNASQLAQVRSLDDLLLGVSYIQRAWEKAKPAFLVDHQKRAEEVLRIMAAPIDLGVLLYVVYPAEGGDPGVDWTGLSFDHEVEMVLRHYLPTTVAALGRRIRCSLPTPEVDKLKAQVAGLLADIEARKAHEAELWGHLRASQDETSTARGWAGRLQRQLDECDCEE